MRLTVLCILLPLFVSSTHSFSIPWRFMKSLAITHVKKLNLDKDCAADLESLILDTSDFQLWALKMLDANAKLNSGFLTGHVLSIGDYDECLSVKEKVRGRDIIGQYCTLPLGIVENPLHSKTSGLIPKYVLKKRSRMTDPGQIGPEIDEKIIAIVPLGVCVPKSCSIANLDKVLLFIEKKFNLTKHIPLIEEVCVSKDTPIEFTSLDIGIYCFFTIVFLIIFICTVYDIHLRHSGQNSNFLVIFSAYSNAKSLFSYQFTTQNSLDCLDGIKVISAFWVLLGHMLVGFGGTSKNLLYIGTEWKNNIWNAPIWSAFYAVDNFFTISGLLLTYTYLRISKTSSVNLLTFYWARFLRLTPGLLAIALIHTSFTKLLVLGPFARVISKTFGKTCEDEWWKALFHFVSWNRAQMCVQHGWYIAADSELYVCAPLALFFLKKHPRRVMMGLASVFLAGVIYSSVITVTENIGFVPFLYTMEIDYSLYHRLWHRVPSWVVGVIFGYLLHENKIKISRFWNLALWTISSLTMIKLITDQLIFFHEDFNVYRNVVWNALARPAWSLALCLMITSCATGNGGFINSFLSHPIFRILRRLTYAFYLLHVGVLGAHFMNIKGTHFFNNPKLFAEGFFFTVVLLISSVPFYLAFEAPLDAWRIYNKKVDEEKMKQKTN